VATATVAGWGTGAGTVVACGLELCTGAGLEPAVAPADGAGGTELIGFDGPVELLGGWVAAFTAGAGLGDGTGAGVAAWLVVE
jgi:hypothetical protein